MNKIIRSLAAALVVVVGFVACSEDRACAASTPAPAPRPATPAPRPAAPAPKPAVTTPKAPAITVAPTKGTTSPTVKTPTTVKTTPPTVRARTTTPPTTRPSYVPTRGHYRDPSTNVYWYDGRYLYPPTVGVPYWYFVDVNRRDCVEEKIEAPAPPEEFR